MLFALTLLAAAMTRLGDLAATVATDTPPPCPCFCVTGTVSYVLVYEDNCCHVLAEGDDVGVDITGSFAICPRPEPGDVVRFDGSIVPRGAGSVQPEFTHLEIIGHGEPPKAREGPSAEIMGGLHDFRRAHLVGEIRDVQPSGTNPCWNYLSIISGGSQYYAPVPIHGAKLSQLETLVGAKVRLDGFPDPHNCSLRFLDERRFMVAGLDNIKILQPPPADPFDGAPSVHALRRLAPETLPRLGRHKTAGLLLTVWQSRHALLKMRDGRIAVVDFSKSAAALRGSYVEVIGYPSTDGFTLRLSRALVRHADGAAPLAEPEAEDLSGDGFSRLLSDDTLTKVSIQGRRLRLTGAIADFSEVQRESRVVPLAIAGHLLEVDFSSAPETGRSIVPGCRVRVTGTCALASENWAELSTGVELKGIRLVIDRPGDVEILAHPPWWTPARLTAVIAALLLVLAAFLVWNRELRHLSEKRGRELFRERSASALAELKTAERTRLAAEIHDSLSQILTGAAMQLDAGETGAAKRILSSCRRELRACLWDLRSHALDIKEFSDAVRETLAPHLGGRTAKIDFDIPSSKMSETLRHAALCIIREATANAVRHGNAEVIAISGELAGNRLSFSVIDDGRGFDPSTIRGSAEGHFGILGMRERAKAFNGSVSISSEPGNGTEISVSLEEPEPQE
ncbi:MAG: sensor histidine kinase [Kiritimatiellae bacterium]|nr:sensor histidine kinase [Kiritimatiellia bacterium]